MPLMNKNYVSPAWLDNAAPPINDDELNAMSGAVEGSQIFMGSGAPTSSTPGKVGQRYADMNTTPPTIYKVSEEWPFYGQPIPKMQTKEEIMEGGYLTGKGAAPYESWEIRAGSDNNHDITVAGLDIADHLIITATCPTEGATIYYTYPNSQIVNSWSLHNFSEEYGLYYVNSGLTFATSPYTYTIPKYRSLNKLLEAVANRATAWKQEEDPNRNMAQEYSTGGSYAAGDYCIHEGILFKALEAVNGGAWDGSKWELARYADKLSDHIADGENPHHVTAAQTGAVSPEALATVQATTTAVRDYYAGEYFFYEGQLYEVREAVQHGGDLFAEYTPGNVTIYDLGTAYQAVSYDGSSTDAIIVYSGFSMTINRVSEYNPNPPLPSSAKYFYWDNEGTRHIVLFSDDRDDWNRNNYPNTFELRMTPPPAGEDSFLFTTVGIVPGQSQVGDIYYQERELPGMYDPPRFPDGYPFPTNNTTLVGDSVALISFIAGLGIGRRKSEPAVLGDGVASLRPKVGAVTLGTSWSGSGPYSQTVTVTGADVTGKSKIDLTPTAAQLAQLAEDGVLSLTIENNGGTLTAWAVGAQPSGAMTISCVVRETV